MTTGPSSAAGDAAAPPAGGAARRTISGLAITIVLGVGIILGAVASGAWGTGSTTPSPSPGNGSAVPTVPPTPLPSPSAPLGTPPPLPSPSPLVPSALTGVLVSPTAAMRHPIAVMIDDQAGARPQSGFNAASIVWQAPAEGGIPRYMLIFQDEIPRDVGPIRSSRQYYIEWAAEWRAMYVHHGGSPQALATLATYGSGQWVWNADGFRWVGRYLWRVTDGKHVAPHNVYTDGKHLRRLAARIGADDGALQPAWRFGPKPPIWARPTGTRITVDYSGYESIQYRYDPRTNTYRRFVQPPYGGAYQRQRDAGDGRPVAPTNVVILRMAFGPLLTNGVQVHGRLEAHDVGRGVAWISSNGVTVKGTWRKKSPTAPTRLFGPDGRPIELAAGQTFVQVMKLTDSVTIHDGIVPPPPSLPPFSRLLL